MICQGPSEFAADSIIKTVPCGLPLRFHFILIDELQWFQLLYRQEQKVPQALEPDLLI
jgi:hypothetical protein